jgi:spore coat polysaccharide biosynthesis predicted glycosyltransferase SpsG
VFALVADEHGREIANADQIDLREVDSADATVAILDELQPEVLVIDDYAMPADEIATLHARVPNTLVLDDRADRRLDVAAVLNANPVAPTYDVPVSCLQLLGARYALLRPAFRDLPRRDVTACVQCVLVTLGGSNPGNLTGALVAQVLESLPSTIVEVVAGPLFRGQLPDDPRVLVHRAPRDMVKLMLRADLAIAAGGQTTYELAACGVPALALCVAENQRANLAALAMVPTLRITTEAALAGDVRALAADRETRQAFAAAGQELVDGYGATRAWTELATRWKIA